MLLFKTRNLKTAYCKFKKYQKEQPFLNNVTPMSLNWIKVYSLALGGKLGSGIYP